MTSSKDGLYEGCLANRQRRISCKSDTNGWEDRLVLKLVGLHL